ncbi:membrane protein insertion efficiency factor YidD [Candidatus Sumerlaeota bacterium]|nr:membrane protein insertion efficiency factor YidD [Candidatus Sumerlaeota bacterium]
MCAESAESNAFRKPRFPGARPWRGLSAVCYALVRLYQWTLSPLLGGQCRFIPTCSEYALQVLTRKPIYTALPLIVWRVLRCNPFCKGGYDPPPESEVALREDEAECSDETE